MQKTQKIFKALSMKDALDVYLTIYAGCKIEYYLTFKQLAMKLSINENTLRRITNSLSRNKLIKSISGFGRERVYVVVDSKLADKIIDIGNPS